MAPSTRWKCSSRSARTTSPAARQQMQPPAMTTMRSLAWRTSAWSMAISPSSFTRTAVSAKRGSCSQRLSRVVLPLPRKPVSTVTGVMPDPATSALGLALGPGAASAGMGRIVDLGEVLEIEVRIHLGRGDARVPQHLLHRAQVARGLQHVGSEGVTQHVRVHVHREARLGGAMLDAALDLARRKAAA